MVREGHLERVSRGGLRGQLVLEPIHIHPLHRTGRRQQLAVVETYVEEYYQ